MAASDRRTALEVGWRDGERQRSVNGKGTTLADHLTVLPVVAWTSAESEVLVGPPALRRRFLDRGLVGSRPARLEVLSRYRRTLGQKRDLLAAGKGVVGPWNELLAASATEVIAARKAYVERLGEALSEVLGLSGLGLPEIGLRYRPSPRRGLEGEEAIREVLARLAARERERRIPLVGPHRDDLEILWGGHPIRAVASAGERKALSLLLLAAQGRVLAATGRSPVYLLDDADSELAPATLAGLWPVFGEAEQLVASSNRPAVWADLRVHRRWFIERGALRPDNAPADAT